MDTTNQKEERRDGVQPPVREDEIQGHVRDVAAKGVGQDVSPFCWGGDWLILRDTEQVVGEVVDHKGLYAARVWASRASMWTEPTFWATRVAAMAAAEKRFMECNR